MAEIQRMSIKHTDILNFLMTNSLVKLKDVADHFEITQAWLSTIIHSDIFQAKLKEREDIHFHHTILPIKEKMHAVASLALDHLIERIPHELEPAKLSDIAADVLDRLGYGSKSAGAAVQINNTVQINNVQRNEIEAAKQLLGKAERPVIGVVIDDVRTTTEVFAESGPSLGPRRDERTFHEIEAEFECLPERASV